jgi:hypothetical protein
MMAYVPTTLAELCGLLDGLARFEDRSRDEKLLAAVMVAARVRTGLLNPVMLFDRTIAAAERLRRGRRYWSMVARETYRMPVLPKA